MVIGFDIIHGKHLLQVELGNNLKHSFHEAGIIIKNQKNIKDAIWINILVSRSEVKKGDYHIVWQMDQPGNSEYNNSERYKKCMKIWEFSYLSNEDRIKQGFESIYIPFPLPNMKNRINIDINNKPIDILLLGASTNRRKNIIKLLVDNGINARLENNLWAEKKVNIISKSKIILNIHYYNPSYQEPYRILEGLFYGACVISEMSKDKNMDKVLEGPSVSFIDENLSINETVTQITDKFNFFLEKFEENREEILEHSKNLIENNQKQIIEILKSEHEYFSKIYKNL